VMSSAVSPQPQDRFHADDTDKHGFSFWFFG
jgi:hypothetical protein